MTTITIDVPEELAAAINQRGNAFAVAVLADAILADAVYEDDRVYGISPDSDAEMAAWWKSLSEEQRNIEIAAIQKGLDAIDAGRSSIAEEVMARIRRKQGVVSATQ
jgi:hypothetical protein